VYPYPISTEIYMPLYDFSQDFYPTYPVQLPASHFNDDEYMSEAGINDYPTSLIPTYVYIWVSGAYDLLRIAVVK
jgi:hypothetical protein